MAGDRRRARRGVRWLISHVAPVYFRTSYCSIGATAGEHDRMRDSWWQFRDRVWRHRTRLA